MTAAIVKAGKLSSISIMVAGVFFTVGSLPFVATWIGATPAAWLCLIGILSFTWGATLLMRVLGNPQMLSEPAGAPLTWISCVTQYIGAFLFIANCIQSIRAAVLDLPTPVPGWLMDALGSIMFMISCSLSVAAVWSRKPATRAQKLTDAANWVYLLGAVAFLVGVAYGWGALYGGEKAGADIDGYATAAGATLYFIGALLSYIAAADEAPSVRHVSLTPSTAGN